MMYSFLIYTLLEAQPAFNQLTEWISILAMIVGMAAPIIIVVIQNKILTANALMKKEIECKLDELKKDMVTKAVFDVEIKHLNKQIDELKKQERR